MPISKSAKIFIAIIIAILLVAIIFIIVRNKSNTVSTETGTVADQPASATTSLPQSSQQTTPVQKPPVEGSFQIEKQASYSYDILKNDPGAEASAKNTKRDFELDDIGVSTPSATAKLKNGDEIILLSGCTPHFCGGTGIVIAYNKSDKKSYILKEKVVSAAGYEIFGNPPEEIKNLLIYYFFYQ